MKTFSAKQWNYKLEYKLLGDTVSRIQEYGKKVLARLTSGGSNGYTSNVPGRYRYRSDKFSLRSKRIVSRVYPENE